MRERLHYFFQSTQGLILPAIAMVSSVTAFWGTLSGPKMERGVRDLAVDLTGVQMVPVESDSQIIMRCHTNSLATKTGIDPKCWPLVTQNNSGNIRI